MYSACLTLMNYEYGSHVLPYSLHVIQLSLLYTFPSSMNQAYSNACAFPKFLLLSFPPVFQLFFFMISFLQFCDHLYNDLSLEGFPFSEIFKPSMEFFLPKVTVCYDYIHLFITQLLTTQFLQSISLSLDSTHSGTNNLRHLLELSLLSISWYSFFSLV